MRSRGRRVERPGLESGSGVFDLLHESFPTRLSRFWALFCKLPKRMATAQSLPASTTATKPGAASAPAAASSSAAAGAPVTPGRSTAIEHVPPAVPPEDVDQADWAVFKGRVARLPVELDVSIPVRDFRVRHLLALAQGQVIESRWTSGEDVPLAAGEVQLAWSEFEVIDTQLAVRVTHVA